MVNRIDAGEHFSRRILAEEGKPQFEQPIPHRSLQTEDGDVPRAKAKLRGIQRTLNGSLPTPLPKTNEANYIEVKAYSATTVTSTLVRKLIQKATIMGVVTTATITKPAKTLLDEADIAWVEQFPEDQLQ